MSTRIEHLKTVEPVPVVELEKLHTGSLLSRLKRLRSLPDSFAQSDWSQEERDVAEKAGLIAFKNSEKWKTAFEDVKRLLSEREHLPRGSKEQRQADAHRKRHR